MSYNATKSYNLTCNDYKVNMNKYYYRLHVRRVYTERQELCNTVETKQHFQKY